MDINGWLRSPSSYKVIGGISCLQGGIGSGKGPSGGRIARIGSNGDWVDFGRISGLPCCKA